MLTQVRKKTMEISLLTDIGQKRSNNQDFVNKFVNQAGVTLVVVMLGIHVLPLSVMVSISN